MTAEQRDGPGTIRSVVYLGREEPGADARCPAEVYFLTYRSGAGGSDLAAKLHVPVGEPPARGWPVSVWGHGMGDPASDFRRWPFAGPDWRNCRGTLAGRWAQHGFVTLTPWLPGAGPSEPHATYSPLSLPRNAQALADGFLALQHLERSWADRPELARSPSARPRFDHTRQVLRADCVSTASLVYLASRWRGYAGTQGLRALVVDDFQPSLAYVASYLAPFACALPPLEAAAQWSVWARVRWSLAEDQGWPLTTYFTERAAAFLAEKVRMPVGERGRLYALRLVPLAKSELAPLLLTAVTGDLGRTPTGTEIMDWLYVPAMVRWYCLPTLKEMVNDPHYQAYGAAFDPFFEETISPFTPGLPLLAVGRGDPTPLGGMPSLAERYHHLTLPRLQTLRSWGWDVRVFGGGPDGGTSFSGGPAQQWALRQLAELLGSKG